MIPYKIDQVAIQLYTLRDYCKTLPDLVETFRKVREIGYRAVQVSGVAVPYPELKKALADFGLHCCATHEASDLILNEPAKASERLSILGCAETAYPYPVGIDFKSEAVVRDFVKKLDAAGALLAKNGQTLSYHNHAHEFMRFGDATVLDYIYAATNPAHLKAELDTYWIQYGGGDPVEWCEKMKGRLPLLHLKDYTVTSEGKPTYGAIGSGTLNWKRILTAAGNSGCRWLIVEQDTCPGDPFVSIRESFDYLKNLLES